MKNISRREQLKQLGFAAVGALGVPHLNFRGRSPVGTTTPPRARTVASSPQTVSEWPWSRDEPGDANPGIRLIFIGMMLFTYKDDEGRVAFHRGPTHDLRVVVFEKCKEVFRLGSGTTHLKKMKLELVGQPNNVRFYGLSSFDRTKSGNKDKDFQWLLDLEKSPYNTTTLPRTNQWFNTKLELGQGTFYTYKHTYARFLAKSNCAGPACKCGVSSCQCNCKDVGSVAEIMAADIAASPGVQASFRFEFDGGSQFELPPLQPDPAAGITYEIYFLNSYQGGATSLGDFNMVFDAVNASPNQKFELERYAPGRNLFPAGLCVNKPPTRMSRKPQPPHQKHSLASYDSMSTLSLSDLVEIMLNDEAPCMGGGLGTGGGFP